MKTEIVDAGNKDLRCLACRLEVCSVSVTVAHKSCDVAVEVVVHVLEDSSLDVEVSSDMGNVAQDFAASGLKERDIARRSLTKMVYVCCMAIVQSTVSLLVIGHHDEREAAEEAEQMDDREKLLDMRLGRYVVRALVDHNLARGVCLKMPAEVDDSLGSFVEVVQLALALLGLIASELRCHQLPY